MEPFEALHQGGQVRRLRRLAEVALPAYPLREPCLRPVAHLFNTIFQVETPEGSKFALRIQRPDQSDVDVVHSEMLWLAALRRETNLSVPEPVCASDGALLTVAGHEGVPEPRICVLFRWMEGRFFDGSLTPAHLERVGAFTARLHQHAAQFTPPAGFTRGRVENLSCRDNGHADPFSDEALAYARSLVAALRPAEDVALVEAALVKLRRTLGQLIQEPEMVGLIHADLHQENFLFYRGEVRAIDFDDCGYGHFLYDLAVTLREMRSRQDYPALREALLRGYRRIRPLASEYEEYLESFFALRRLQLMIWGMEMREHPLWRKGWPAFVTRALQTLQTFVEA